MGAFTVTVAVVEVVTQVGGGPLDADDVMDVIWLAVVVVVVHAYAGETATAERASMRKNILRSVIGLDVQLLYLRKSTGHYFVSVVTNLKATDAKLDHPPCTHLRRLSPSKEAAPSPRLIRIPITRVIPQSKHRCSRFQ